MRKLWRLVLVSTLLLGSVGCDQVSKGVARSLLEPGQTHAFFGDTLRFVYAENPGAFLGLGASLPEPVRTVLFQGVVALLVCGLLWAAAFRSGVHLWMAAGLTLMAASGAGNLIDRLMHDGRVTDFLNLGIGGLRTGIFNVADVVGVVGVTMILLARAPPTPSNSALERRG